jgi:hypothetical protein
MAIKSGRQGQVKMGADDLTAVAVASLNNWTLSLATEMIEVTCFLDLNKVYLPSMRDLSGTVGGYWNSEELAIIEATDDEAPLHLVLIPNVSEATFEFSGPAYISAEIEVPVNGAPTLSGTFSAAGAWEIPTAALMARRRDERKSAA